MRLAIVLLLAAVVTGGATACAREWTDSTGQHKVEAELVEVKNGQAVLKRSDGQTIAVPLVRLSTPDREFIRQELRRRASADDQPTDDGPPVRKMAGRPEAPPAAPRHTAGEDAADEPLAGQLFGQPFEARAIEVEEDRITFASEDEMFPAQSVLIFLFSDADSLAGQQFTVPSRNRGNIPHLHLKTLEPRNTEMVTQGYTMQLSFDQGEGRTLTGQIDLRVPEHQTSLSGRFTAEVAKDYSKPPTEEDVPYIVARVPAPRGASEEHKVSSGYVGMTAAGEIVSNGAGTRWGQGGRVSSLTYEPRVTTTLVDGRTATAQHVGLEPGNYFHYLLWNDGYLVGEWVEVTGDSQLESEFQIDLAQTGELQVKTTAASGRSLSLAPLAVLEQATARELPVDRLVARLPLDARPEEGLVQFRMLRPGRYLLIGADVEQAIEIRPGETTTIDLEANVLEATAE